MRWLVESGMRCDLVFYAAPNLSGKRATLRIFPGGNKQGTDIAPEDLRSMVIRAPLGTRLVLCRSSGPDWEDLAWRCVRLVEGQVVPPERPGGMPGVRLPDLDLLDTPDAKHTSRELQSTYDHAERLTDGGGWTFGRRGELKGRVTTIRIERDGANDVRPEGAGPKFADALLRRIVEVDPALARAVAPHVTALLAQGPGPGAQEKAEALVNNALRSGDHNQQS